MNIYDVESVELQIGISIGLIIYIFCFILLFLGKLFLLHLWLCIQNLTFYEHIKEKWKSYPYKNPFDKKSCWLNFSGLICKKIPKPSLDVNKSKDTKKGNLIYTDLIQF